MILLKITFPYFLSLRNRCEFEGNDKSGYWNEQGMNENIG